MKIVQSFYILPSSYFEKLVLCEVLPLAVEAWESDRLQFVVGKLKIGKNGRCE